MAKKKFNKRKVQIPLPPRELCTFRHERVKVRFGDLSGPLKIAAVMGIFEFVVLMFWLILLLIIGLAAVV